MFQMDLFIEADKPAHDMLRAEQKLRNGTCDKDLYKQHEAKVIRQRIIESAKKIDW